MDEQPKKAIHPLLAGAAIAVIAASAVGVAAMTGNLPRSSAQAPASAGSTAVASAPKPKCLDCGVISAIRAVEVKGEGTGLGAVAGGVAGAVLGNEIGEGRNRKLVTVAGAAGGALAGHEIEKHARTQKRFDVSVRMDDGTTKTVSFAAEPAWRAGQRVRVANGKIAPI